MKPADCWHTRVITDAKTLEQLSPEWTGLWNRCPGATPFQRPEWALSWIQAFHPRELYVIEIRRGERLVGLAPLFCYPSGAKKILAPLAASVSDYVDWLIEPVRNTEISEKIFQYLRSSERPWDRLDLTDLPSTSCLLALDFANWDCERSIETVCPVLWLPGTARSVEEVLPSKQRHNLRTARRRMERAGKARVEIATRETLDEFLAALVRLHGARWTRSGTSGMLADTAVQQFHRLATSSLLRRHVLRLYGLRFNGQLIAALYALAERDIVYCYLQGFDPEYGAFSPGAQILAAAIDDAIRQGKIAVDFLRGGELYKYAWGTRDQTTYRICLRRPVEVPHSARPIVAA